MAVIVLPAEARAGAWLPLHLAMGGAASTAIAGVMPFSGAAFAAAPPTDARLRWSSVLLVASGSLAVTVGYVNGAGVLAASGGVLFMVALALGSTAVLLIAAVLVGLGNVRGAASSTT